MQLCLLGQVYANQGRNFTLSENVSAFNFNTFNFKVTSEIIHDPEIFSKEKTKYILILKLNSVFNLTYSKMFFFNIQFYEI